MNLQMAAENQLFGKAKQMYNVKGCVNNKSTHDSKHADITLDIAKWSQLMHNIVYLLIFLFNFSPTCFGT
jgi:hypothetical protein